LGLTVPVQRYGYATVADLYINAEPVASIMTTYDRSNIFELPFNAEEGDYIMLKKHDCNGARTIDGSVPGGPSYLTQLDSGGVAREKALAQSLIDELDVGFYKVCYATKSSEADSDADFTDLSRTIEITIDVEGIPTMSVSSIMVGIGQDVVIQWSTNRAMDRTNTGKDWIGIYKKGACAEPLWWSNGLSESPGPETSPSDRHKCYLEQFDLPFNTASGEVRFKLTLAGEYEARYFKSDKRYGQGYVCNRLPGQGASGYIHCVLKAAAVTEVITVMSNALTFTQGSMSGLESVNVPYMY